MPRHPLKREIIATHVTNSMLNRVGSTFVHRLMEIDGRQAARDRPRLSADAARSSASSRCGRRSRRSTTRSTTRVQSAMLIDIEPLTRARHDVVPALAAADRGHGRDDRALRSARRGAGGAVAERCSTRRRPRARRRRRSPAMSRRACPKPLAARVVDARRRFTRRSTSSRSPTRRSGPVELVARDLFRPVDAPRRAVAARQDRARCRADQHWQMLAKGAMLDDLSGLQRAHRRAKC